MEKEDFNAHFLPKLICFYSNQEGIFMTFSKILFYKNKADIISFPMTYDKWVCVYDMFVTSSPKNMSALFSSHFQRICFWELEIAD